VCSGGLTGVGGMQMVTCAFCVALKSLYCDCVIYVTISP
jgi:hypothetical protein